MTHLLSALIVGAFYSSGYAFRGKRLDVYKISVALLFLLIGGTTLAFLLEESIHGMMNESYWSTFTYAREILVHSLWVQSLICAVLSIASFINIRNWRYLAGSVFFAVIFILLAYATSNPVLAATLL